MKIENKEAKTRKYELAFVIKSEDVSVIAKLLANGGFAVLTENPLEKIQLAYPIKKEDYAYFGCCHFEGEPAAIKNLRADLKLNSEILRYLIITPPFIKKPAWRKSESDTAPQEAKTIPPIERQAVSTGKQALPAESILTNEALEKKIEEILR